MAIKIPAIRLPSPSLYIPGGFGMPKTSSVGFHQEDVCYDSNYAMMAAVVNGAPHTEAVFRNVIWRKYWKWGARLYGLQATFMRMLVEDIRQEHGHYFSPNGGTTSFEHVTWRNCNSQGPQLRIDMTSPTDSLHFQKAKVIKFSNCNLLECATGTQGPGRPAFSLSAYNAGPLSDLFMKNVFIQSVHGKDFVYNNQTYNTYGGLYVGRYNNVFGENVTIELKRPRNPAAMFFSYNVSGYQASPASIELDRFVVPTGRIQFAFGPNCDTQRIRLTGGRGNGTVQVFYWNGTKWIAGITQPVNQPLSLG